MTTTTTTYTWTTWTFIQQKKKKRLSERRSCCCCCCYKRASICRWHNFPAILQRLYIQKFVLLLQQTLLQASICMYIQFVEGEREKGMVMTSLYMYIYISICYMKIKKDHTRQSTIQNMKKENLLMMTILDVVVVVEQYPRRDIVYVWDYNLK